MSFEPHDPVTAGPLSYARKDADCAAHDPLACEPAILQLWHYSYHSKQFVEFPSRFIPLTLYLSFARNRFGFG